MTMLLLFPSGFYLQFGLCPEDSHQVEEATRQLMMNLSFATSGQHPQHMRRGLPRLCLALNPQPQVHTKAFSRMPRQVALYILRSPVP